MDGVAKPTDEAAGITAAVLAAGDSQRMGFPKALLPLGPGTFISRIVLTLRELKLREIIVVLGAHEPLIRPLLDGPSTRILVNPNPALGQTSSIRIAFAGADPHSAGCLVWPVDHPCVSAALVSTLITRFEESRAPLVLPVCHGRPGHPAVFGRALAQEVLAAPRHITAKQLVSAHRHETILVPTEERGTIEDIDTPADYERIAGETLEAALARAAERKGGLPLKK